MERGTQPPTEPRALRGMRRRLLRHHLPLALASGLVLVLFMTVPRFGPSPPPDIFTGTFPRDYPGDRAGSIQHTGPPQQQGGGHRPPQAGADHQPPQQQGAGQTPSVGPSAEDVRDRSFERRLTVATGYVALGLLALTLLIGPANLVLRRRNPVSSYLRRDVGAWTAAFSGVHVIPALWVHGTGQVSDFLDFFVADGSVLRNSFGLGNWTGLAALVLAAALLALSSDAALRKLKARSWKRLQRLNYVLFGLVVAHAFFYGALLRETSPYTILLGLCVVAVVVGQGVGVWLFRRRSSRRAAEPA